MDGETMVTEYIEALESAAATVTPERRAELLVEVREHIDLALADAGSTDEATVRTVLDRLGSPAEIVAAEIGLDQPFSDASTPTGATVRDGGRSLSVEARALLLLTVGAVVLPFIGPILGLWVASSSERWTLAQKRTAALMVVVLLALPFVVLMPMLVAGELTWVVTSGGFLLPLIPLAGFVAAAYLVVSTSVVLTISRRA